MGTRGGRVGARALAIVSASFATVGSLTIGCADPCFDDGLAQGGCPEVPAASTEGSTGRATDDATATATRGGGGDATDAVDSTAESTAASGGGDGLDCPEFQEVLLPQIPTFQLVVDQSGSMDEDFGGTSRWEAMRETLIGPAGVVTELQSSIRFGVSLYRNPASGMCPEVQSLLPQLDAADEIAGLLNGEQPGGDTPTGESFALITDELLADRWKGDKIIVLATDGEPDTCAIPEPADAAETDIVRAVAVDAVAAAFNDDIRTFVISVGTNIAEAHLQDLANAGVGTAPGDPDAPFYVANDTTALVDAFNDIVAGLRPCTFALSTPLMDDLAPSCEVTINDAPVPFGEADGWGLPDAETLELRGTACEAIQQGVVSISLVCSCER
ncbi:MAG: VWA domain-containing protein [Deltaproteobacteria bacterium]|nr:VWA domain-containing protein [Deltaproteobacteria bacterium]